MQGAKTPIKIGLFVSIEAINWALNLNLPPSPKLVTIVLANYTNENGQCWPSFETIAKKTSLSRRSVISQIAYLEKNGILKKIKRHDSASNIYELNLNTSENISPVTHQKGSENISPPSEISSPEVVKPFHHLVNDVHQGSEPVSPPLVNVLHPNHQLNHQRNIYRNIEREKKRGCTLPEDFTLTEKHRALAKKYNILDVDEQFEHFRDYHLSRGTVFKSWDAGFRTWLHRAASFTPKQKKQTLEEHNATVAKNWLKNSEGVDYV